MDENFARMKKSCDRIAAVLGLKEGPDGTRTFTRRSANGGGISTVPSQSNGASMPETIHRSPLRPAAEADLGANREMKFTNMNNPSLVRHIGPQTGTAQEG